ncbi:MAG: RNA-binding transcriptional accessory protein, partial [Candidatus Fermentibacteraceae bacterium]|nr:RNA-binding transcriptional accessory protein [Candidatus Fermentibacteraceae bacterium]
MSFQKSVALELGLDLKRVEEVLALMEQGATIPFIARYRKEVSGGMDEVVLQSVRETWQKLQALDKRKTAVVSSLKERNLLTEKLEKQITEASSLAILEDIYLPFRPKRRTRATIAAENGLEPLAELLLQQNDTDDPAVLGLQFTGENVPDSDAALSGAADIIAERMTHHPGVRAEMRSLYMKQGR